MFFFVEQITKKLMSNKHVEMMENEEELTVYSGSNEGHRNRNVENSTSEVYTGFSLSNLV